VGHISGYDGFIEGDKARVTNCYATGAVSDIYNVGGVAGSTFSGGIVTRCAALNPSITRIGGSDTEFGRVAGFIYESPTLTNNASYLGMLLSNGATGVNGTEMTHSQIINDGSIGGRFTAPVWTTANGSLPGFGATVTLPTHLR